jgi:cation diffusion facilitator family transporter
MPTDAMKKIKQILRIILAANLAVAGIKIVVGQWIMSASLTADGFHSLTDGISNVVGLIGIWFAAQPTDENHPYGHRKYEFVTGLFIGFMLLLIAAIVLYESVTKFLSPVAPAITTVSLVALIATLAVNIAVCIFEYRQGKRLGSAILISDSLHTRSDVYVSLSVLFTLVGIQFGLPPIIDPVASLVVAAFILRAAYGIIRSTSDVLVDTAVADSDKIREIALSFPAVRGVHDIRSRGSDQELYIDMHILIDPTMGIDASHQLSHAVEQKIRQALQVKARVMIHMEPFYTVTRTPDGQVHGKV